MKKNNILRLISQLLIVNVLVWSGTDVFAMESPKGITNPPDSSEVIRGKSNLVTVADYDNANYEAPALSPKMAIVPPENRSPSFIDNISKIAGNLLANLQIIAIAVIITTLIYGYRKAMPALANIRMEYTKVLPHLHPGKYSLLLHRQKKTSSV